MTSVQAASPVRVLIADDNLVVRRGLRLRLQRAADVSVVAEAATGTAAVALARARRAQVVLMDLQMPGGSGLAATRALAGPGVDDRIAVVVLTNHAEPAYAIEALDAGAVGYLLKATDTGDLLAAVRAAARGEAFVSSHVTAPVLREFARRARSTLHDPSIGELTRAELEVVSLLAGGLTSNEDIAGALSVSVNTVRAQLSSALRKTGLSDRTQLALWAVKRGLDLRESPGTTGASSDRTKSGNGSPAAGQVSR